MTIYARFDGRSIAECTRGAENCPCLQEQAQTPYPWCHGSPTKADCTARGYCNRNPNCGE